MVPAINRWAILDRPSGTGRRGTAVCVKQTVGFPELLPALTVPASPTYVRHMKPRAVRNPRPDRRQQDAFTLPELLVVLCVVTALALLTVTAMAHSQPSSDRAGCANNLRRLMQAWQMYVDDNAGRLMPNRADNPGRAWVSGTLDSFPSNRDNTNTIIFSLWPEAPVFRIIVRDEWPPRVGEALVFRSPFSKPSNFPGASDTAPSDLACDCAAGRFRPPGVGFPFAPVPVPAIPARCRAGCSSSPRSPHSAGSRRARRPDTGSIRDVPNC